MNIFKNKINDTFLRGVIGGLIAGTIKDIPDIFLVEIWHIKKLSFWGYVGQMCLNIIPHNFIQHFATFLIEVTFSMGIGVFYSMFVVQWVPTKHYLIRGLSYGATCWFILISILEIYKIKPVLTTDVITPVLTLFFSSLYGFLLSYMDKNWSPNHWQLSK